MKVINTYIVTTKVSGFSGDYTTVLYECIENNWYLMSKSTFGPGTVFSGLNSFRKIQIEEALEIIENSKINTPK